MKTDPVDALNRLLLLLCRSFPAYLTYARPYASRSNGKALEVFDQIVADQRRMADRISRAIIELGGDPDDGSFPMRYADLHDLEIDYVVRLAIEYQRQDVAAIEAIVSELRLSAPALHVAEETLGLAKGHMELLEELMGQPAL